MVNVLNQGAECSNKIREQRGERPIPTSIGFYELKAPPPTLPLVDISHVQSILCVTYAPDIDKADSSQSGFFVNVYPWVPWRSGKSVSVAKVLDGPKAKVLSAAERKLRNKLKIIDDKKHLNFNTLRKQYDKRCQILRELNLDVKAIHSTEF